MTSPLLVWSKDTAHVVRDTCTDGSFVYNVHADFEDATVEFACQDEAHAERLARAINATCWIECCTEVA